MHHMIYVGRYIVQFCISDEVNNTLDLESSFIATYGETVNESIDLFFHSFYEFSSQGMEISFVAEMF